MTWLLLFDILEREEEDQEHTPCINRMENDVLCCDHGGGDVGRVEYPRQRFIRTLFRRFLPALVVMIHAP
jgi:hypothetical protein